MLLMTKKRKQKGWDQMQLASESHLHYTTINAIERQRLIAYPGQRTKISKALGWPQDRADELFEVVE